MNYQPPSSSWSLERILNIVVATSLTSQKLGHFFE
ncbi:hypothetical protein I3842_15G033900 [Carya illinoinensis]|uniref:Uncharacterized protein n=1 Tax=Carya illinoinensis TaxID=32201 RepID=A0A922DA90_CARIL|nr:hypothetical protein I3842_15G033900 [Carya illinoinensis]